MKPIFYFVSAGRIRQPDRDAATAINEATGKRVVFRNGTSGEEAAEPCSATAGKCVPPQYKHLPHYDSAGNLVDNGAPQEAGQEAIQEIPESLNSYGLPEGCPDTRDGLKEALESASIEFHPNIKTDKLIDLYRATFLS